MTTTEMSPSEDAAPSTGDRSIVALLAAGALLVVVVVLVLLFGIARPPALATLADEPTPEPTASIAWTDYHGNETCIYVARPDGSRDELLCEQDLGEVLAWDAEGIVAHSWSPREELIWVDAQTGERIRSEPIEEYGWVEPARDAFVRTTHRDGTLTVSLDEEGVLWEVDVPESYGVNEGLRSPDGDWVAMFDSASRLLVVAADGSAEPRVWTADAVSWEVPIWEGTEVVREDLE